MGGRGDEASHRKRISTFLILISSIEQTRGTLETYFLVFLLC